MGGRAGGCGGLLISASALPSGGKGLRDGRMDKSIHMCSTAGGTKGRRLGQRMRLSFLPPFFSVSLRPRFDSVDGQEDGYIYIQTNGCVSSSEWVNGSLGGWAKSALNGWANKSFG